MSAERLRPQEQEPTSRNFIELLRNRWQEVNSLLCIGLDTDHSKIPEPLRQSPEEHVNLKSFNVSIVESTHDLVCAYKPNIAFYERYGPVGFEALKFTIDFIRQVDPKIPVILDAKRTDIGNTNLPYAEMAFDYFGADAITVNPYFGGEALGPFLDRADKGVIVLCRTSNPGAKEFQDLIVKHPDLGEVPLYQVVAYRAVTEWNKNGNVCLVVGATYPEELAQVRKKVGNMPILIPGLGAQGGKPEDLPLGFDSQQTGIIANNARGIIFATPQEGETFRQAVRREALKWRDAINRYR